MKPSDESTPMCLTGRKPADCISMEQLRAEIDSIDSALLDLLALRFEYVGRAAELKRGNGLPARTVDRVRQVICNVKSKAGAKGLDELLVEKLWTDLIEWSIAQEECLLAVAKRQ